MTFFEALESEKAEARMLDARFPEQLKAAVLKSVQWRTCLLTSRTHKWHSPLTLVLAFTELVGRLDHLVDAVYERFKDRYFEGERMSVSPDQFDRPLMNHVLQVSLSTLRLPRARTNPERPQDAAATGSASFRSSRHQRQSSLTGRERLLRWRMEMLRKNKYLTTYMAI